MVVVNRHSGESVERLISRFRRKVIKKGTLKQARDKQYHVKKKSRRAQKANAMYREKKRKELEKSTWGS